MARSGTPLDDERLDREIEEARARSEIASGPRAVRARYNRRTRRVEVELADEGGLTRRREGAE
jgi:hypothetical protein